MVKTNVAAEAVVTVIVEVMGGYGAEVLAKAEAEAGV